MADLRQRSADIGSFLIETLQASTLIVTSNAQDRERGRFRALNDRFIDALMGMQRLTYLAGGLPGLIVSLGASAVFLYGGSRVVDGTLTLGTFAAFIAYQTRVIAPVQALMGLYTSLATAKVSWRRVLELLDAPVDVREAAGARGPRSRCAATIAFDDVTLGTDRGLAVLEDVTLQRRRPARRWRSWARAAAASPRSPTCCCGCSIPTPAWCASTATTCAPLRLSDIRRHVVLVEQEPTLLHATIAENIRYAPARARPTTTWRAPARPPA